MTDEQERIIKELARLDKEVQRLVRFIASTDMDANMQRSIKDQLESATHQQAAAKERLAILQAKAVEPPRLPSADETAAMVLDLEARVADDPVAAREDLRQLLHDGKIIMQPQPDGSYRGLSHVLPFRLPGPLNAKGPAVAGPLSVVDSDGCGGRI